MEIKNWKRNVFLFITGQGITLFGSMLVHYAIAWHITLQTQSGVMMTLMAIAGVLPMFFISPFAGVWADRYNKKYLIIIADTIISVFTLGLAILFVFDFGLSKLLITGLLLFCMVIRTFGQGVQMPAVNALVPELVPKEHLTRANGFSGGMQSFVMLASPMAGGALLLVAPIYSLMFIDVVTALIGSGVLFFLVKVPARSKEKESKPGAEQYFIEITEGIKYIGTQPFLKKFLILSAFFNILSAPVAMMTPLQVARQWGDDIWNVFGFSVQAEQRLALAESAFFVGMLLGGLTIGIWGGFKNRSRTMALSTFLLGVGTVGLGLISGFWFYAICMGFTGLILNWFNPPMMATLQSTVEPALMGRVFSVLMMMSSLMMPLGMILWGPLGDAVDIRYILIGTGAAVFFMGFVFMFDKTLLKAGLPAEETK
ncbi:MAG: MFS transporter [Clostridiales bacterium]|jgi:DHA3 family macrolide efflux protein-like MFS transporter|nr:MFS transporter [Clostridiales bacterium]